jgi:uncharacterized protein
MRPSNLELARSVIGDLQALFDLMSEDVVLENTLMTTPPDHQGVHRGKETVVGRCLAWVGTWEDYRFEVDEMIEAGDAVVLVVSESGRGKASGVPMHSHYCQTWTFRDGRVVRVASFNDRAAALESLED